MGFVWFVAGTVFAFLMGMNKSTEMDMLGLLDEIRQLSHRVLEKDAVSDENRHFIETLNQSVSKIKNLRTVYDAETAQLNSLLTDIKSMVDLSE